MKQRETTELVSMGTKVCAVPLAQEILRWFSQLSQFFLSCSGLFICTHGRTQEQSFHSLCAATVHAGLRGILDPWSLKIPQGVCRQIIAQLLFIDVQESLISCLRKISV